MEHQGESTNLPALVAVNSTANAPPSASEAVTAGASAPSPPGGVTADRSCTAPCVRTNRGSIWTVTKKES